MSGEPGAAITADGQGSIATRRQWLEQIQTCVEPELERDWRRKQRRYRADGEIRATALADPGAAAGQRWDLWQVSAQGLMARSPREVPEGETYLLVVEFGGQKLLLKGRVKHCTQTVGGYKVGLQLVFAAE